MPRVSVVIPSYNHARFIGDAIASVLSQTLADLELIVIDDGSKDDSVRVCRAIQDSRLRVIAQENRGAHAAINRAVELATSPYVAILNSDDRFERSRLQRLVERLDAEPEAVLAGSWVRVIDEHGGELGVKEGIHTLDPWPSPRPELTFKAERELSLHLLMSNFWATTSNYVFRRELFSRVGGFRALRFAHDWDFAFRAQSCGACVLVPEPLLDYRIHGTNTIRTDRSGMVFEVCWVLARHLPSYARHAGLPVDDPHASRLTLERLHHSLYCYGQDRVLLLLVALFAAANARGAPDEEALLDPEHPARLWLLGLIREDLARGAQAPEATPAQGAGHPARTPTLTRAVSAMRRRLGIAWKAVSGAR